MPRSALHRLAGVLLLLAAGPAQATPIDTCIGRLLAAGADSGAVVDLAALCPGVVDTLTALPLEPPLAERASLTQLLDARAALGSHSLRPAGTVALDRARLQAILTETWQPEEPGWWERLTRWLSDKLGGERVPGFLPELADKLSPSPETAVFLARGVLVVLLLLVLIALLKELQYRRGGRRRRPTMAAVESPPSDLPDWDTLEGLTPVERIRALLRLVLDLLGARGLLRGERALTNRECLVQAGERLPELAEPMGCLVARADRALYGGGAVSEEEGVRAGACAEAIRRSVGG